MNKEGVVETLSFHIITIHNINYSRIVVMKTN